MRKASALTISKHVCLHLLTLFAVEDTELEILRGQLLLDLHELNLEILDERGAAVDHLEGAPSQGRMSGLQDIRGCQVFLLLHGNSDLLRSLELY